MLSKEQFIELRKKGLSVQQIKDFESGITPRVKTQTSGNQFSEEPKGFFAKARDFATNVIGGGALAEGAGMSLAAPKIQNNISKAEDTRFGIETELIRRIRANKAQGKDTSRLETSLRQIQEERKIDSDVQQDFVQALPSNKEVIGSSVRLAGTLGAGVLATGTRAGAISPAVPGFSKVLAFGKANTFTSGLLRGAGVGIATGAAEGAIQGAGIGLEEDKDAKGVAMSALRGAAVGGATGAVVGGALGAYTGASRAARDPNKYIDYITPEAKDLTPTQYKKLLAQGRIQPKTGTQPARVLLSDAEQTTALKYSGLLEKDPVQTTLNINDELASLDQDVGAFLRSNNGIFNKGELKNTILSSIDDVTDINVDPARLDVVKKRMVDNFVNGLKKNDFETLWEARKAYDNKIESAFKGSPSLQKEMKIAFRNSIQDFLSERTPDGVYREYMSDMSNLFKLRDSVALKATKERALTSWGKWMKDNPKTAKALGWGLGTVAAISGGNYLYGKVSGSSD